MLKIAMLIATVLVMYYRTINYGYIIDDVESAQRGNERPPKNKWAMFWEHFKGYKYTNSKLAHSMTLAVHLAVVLLIYTAFGSNNISFLTALLFAINPVNNQVSIWLSGRPYGIAAILLLLGLTLLPLMPFCYALSMLFSINGIMLPVLFTKAQPTVFSLLLIVGAFIVRNRVKGVVKYRVSICTEDMVNRNPKRIIVVFKTIGYYFRHCLFPIRIGMFHAFLHTYGMTKKETESWHNFDKYFFLGVGLVLISIYGFIFHHSPVTIGLFWFVLMTIQWSNMMVLNHPISERYIYLSNIGLMYALANLIIGTPLMWVFLTAYTIRLFYFIPAYKDMVSFWKSNTDNFPSAILGYNQLGLAYFDFGNKGSALDCWIRGVQERPDDFRVNYNIANILVGSGQINESIPFIKKAEAGLNMKDNSTFWRENVDRIKQAVIQSGVAL
jgi:hypothetical protein